MGVMDWVKRGAMAVGTGGLSELGGARPIGEAVMGSQGAKEWLLGGGATKGIASQPVNYDPVTDRLGKIADGSQARVAPAATAVQAGRTQLGAPVQLATGQIDQSRGGMLGVAGQLGGIASGQQLGAGQLAVNRQVGAANAAQQAFARMARGPTSALAARNAARNTADIGLAGAGMAAEAQRADQQAALSQLGGLYGNMYGQDAGVAAQNAQLGQQAMLQQGAMDQQTTLANAQAGNTVALANLQAQLAQTGMNDAQQLAALGQILGWDQATLQAQLAKAQIAAGDKGMLPGLLQLGGQLGAAYATGGMSAAAGGAQKPSGGSPINSLGLMNPYG